MDPATSALGELFKQVGFYAIAAILLLWVLKTTDKREQVLTGQIKEQQVNSEKREALLIEEAQKREAAILQDARTREVKYQQLLTETTSQLVAISVQQKEIALRLESIYKSQEELGSLFKAAVSRALAIGEKSGPVP